MYRIIGADGKAYGPITIEQLKQWIGEGRANAQTQTLADGATEWKPLGALPEFTSSFAPPIPPTISPITGGRFRKTNSLAIAGLVCGILSLTFFCCCGGFPFNLLGLVFSIVALVQIGENPEIYEGRVMAIVGLILSIAGFLFLLAVVASGHTHVVFNGGRFN
jgi:Domain of unknown function (DUF4190)/GYF domain 2